MPSGTYLPRRGSVSRAHLTASLSTNTPTPMTHLHHNNARATKSLRYLINMNIIKTLVFFRLSRPCPHNTPLYTFP